MDVTESLLPFCHGREGIDLGPPAPTEHAPALDQLAPENSASGRIPDLGKITSLQRDWHGLP